MAYILVVEDNPRTAAALADMVGLLGWEVVVAHSPRRALQQLQTSKPALILLDFNMPGVDGLEVCRYIKRDPTAGDIPVVFVSAEEAPSIIEEARKAGAKDYLIKPVNISDLERVLAGIR